MAEKNLLRDVIDRVMRPGSAPETPPPVDAVPDQPEKPHGEAGTPVYGGFVQSNEKDPRLASQARYRAFSENLANVSIVAAGVRYFLNLTASASWKVEPADDSAPAREKAELVEAMMCDMATPWKRVVRRAAMYRFYGFSIQEWTAKRREDGLIGMADVEPRPQMTIRQWDVDRTGTVMGVVQYSPQDQKELYLPRSKLVYCVDDSLSDSPEGLGLFRHLVEPCKRLRRYEFIEGFGIEGDLRGIPVGRAPYKELNDAVAAGTMTAAERARMLNGIETMVRHHVKNPEQGLMMDSSTYAAKDDAQSPSSIYKWGIELLRGEGHGLEETAEAIERLNRELARVLGVEHLLLGTGEGSLALSRDKSHTFYVLVDGSLEEIASMLDRDFVTPIWRLNGWDMKLRPRLKPEAIAFQDVMKVTGALKDLAAAGVVLDPQDPAVQEIRDLIGLSRTPQVILDRQEEDAAMQREAQAAALVGPEGDEPTEPDEGVKSPPDPKDPDEDGEEGPSADPGKDVPKDKTKKPAKARKPSTRKQ